MMNANEAYELTMLTTKNNALAYFATLENVITNAAKQGRFYAWADFSTLTKATQTIVIAKLKEAGYTITQVSRDTLIEWEK